MAIGSRRRAGEERRVDGLAVEGGLAARVGEVHGEILNVAERVDVVAALPRPLETEMILPRALVIDTCTRRQPSMLTGLALRPVRTRCYLKQGFLCGEAGME